MGRRISCRERTAKALAARLVGVVGVVYLALGQVAASDVAASGKSASDTVAATFDQQIRPFLTTYCTECHRADKAKGDLDLACYQRGAQAVADRDQWNHSATRVHGFEMPPEKAAKKPSDAERAQFAAWVRSLRRLTPPDPWIGVMRRLSALEYANTLRELLGVDPAVASEIPQDLVGAGFSSAIPPLLMEKYLLVADAVLDQVIVPDQVQQQWNAGQLDALIDGKRDVGRADATQRRLSGPGEVLVVITAPVDGTYTIRVRAGAEKAPSKDPAIIAVRVDGQLIDQLKIAVSGKTPGTYVAKAKLLAGRSTVSLLFANPLVEVPETPAKAGVAAIPASTVVRTVIIDRVELIGPPAGRPSEIQRRLFVATPGKDVTKRDAAKSIAVAFATRAYRRPLATDEVDTLLKIFDLADGQDEVFSLSIKLMLKAVLVSPAFLHLTPDAAPPAGSDIVAAGPYQLAARLSYLFWSTMPDDELLARATDGTLRDPAVLTAQVKRLIADPRSRVLFRSFGAPWLGVDRLATLTVDEKKYPQMTKDLRTAMYDEAALLFDTILRENRSLIEFVDCDYTFLNGPLARLYGQEASVKGPQLVRVQLSDPNRGGVLTMPGVLAVTSHATRTSPVKRGAWVLDRILGQTPPPPPMNVPPLEKQDTVDNTKLNLRQRTERHRVDPACVSCHRTIDPIGFGLENFDGIGRWREQDDTGQVVDAVGALPNGQSFRGPQDLKRLIGARKDDLCRTLVGKILSFALCRSLTAYDEVIADDIAARVAADGYRFQTVWLAVATSYPFLNYRVTQ